MFKINEIRKLKTLNLNIQSTVIFGDVKSVLKFKKLRKDNKVFSIYV